MRSIQEIAEVSKTFPSPDFRSSTMMAAAVSEGRYLFISMGEYFNVLSFSGINGIKNQSAK